MEITPEQREQMGLNVISRQIRDDHAETLRRWYALAGESRNTPAQRQLIRDYIDALESIDPARAEQPGAEADSAA